NRPGAASNIAAEAAIRSPPDGYTLFMIGPNNAINASVYDKLRFDIVRDSAPVAGILRVPNVMEVNPAVPVTIVLAGGNLDVLSGGTISGTTVSSGGTLELFGGASTNGTVINAGGILEFGSGYTGVGYVVSSGITLEIAAGGIASNMTA